MTRTTTALLLLLAASLCLQTHAVEQQRALFGRVDSMFEWMKNFGNNDSVDDRNDELPSPAPFSFENLQPDGGDGTPAPYPNNFIYITSPPAYYGDGDDEETEEPTGSPDGGAVPANQPQKRLDPDYYEESGSSGEEFFATPTDSPVESPAEATPTLPPVNLIPPVFISVGTREPSPAPAAQVVETTAPTVTMIETTAPTATPLTSEPTSTPTEAPVETSSPTESPVETTATPTTAAPVIAPTVVPVVETTDSPTIVNNDTYPPFDFISPVAAPPTSSAPVPDRSDSSPSVGGGNGIPTPSYVEREDEILDKCTLTVMERTALLRDGLGALSDPVALEDANTAQYAALTWLDATDGAVLCPVDWNVMQRYALALVYFSLNGENWSESQGWLGDGNECSWYGITCDDDDQVTVIRLKDNQLSGELPSELFTAFPALSGLSLDHNSIGGTIPASIENAALVYIELDDNDLSGPFPNLYGMTTLKAIDLNGNQLTGSISDDIGALTELMVLQLEDNLFVGSVPVVGLSLLPNMLLLTLHGNSFSGSLEILCASVEPRRETSPEYLQFFSSDCSVTSCSCCSQCF